jgi:CheY-like chemotaxis protein
LSYLPDNFALTANVLEETRDQCIDAGMDEFLTKPVVAQDLFKTINLSLPEVPESA